MSIDPTIMTPQLAELHRIIRVTMEEEGVSAALIAESRFTLVDALPSGSKLKSVRGSKRTLMRSGKPLKK